MSLTVVDPGTWSLLQDRGRPGLGHLGVSSSGAFDRDALRLANVLLGNDTTATVIEVMGGGLVLRADRPHLVSVTGAPCDILIDGTHASYGRALRIVPGQTLRLGSPVTGLRTYLGVAGGICTDRDLGSSSTDTLAGLGPEPLRSGTVLPTGTAPPNSPHLDDVAPVARSGDLAVDVVLGPRDDWFTSAAVRLLLDTPWRVSPASNRVGVRLDGPRLDRARTDELASEPCIRGSIQVAADGQPIVFGPDHPVTGGYPVIAVVVDGHTDHLAQARPGQVIRLRRAHLR